MSTLSSRRIYNFDYNPPQRSVEEYLLPFKDTLVEHFIGDSRIKSAENKSGCQVKLLTKAINRKIRNAGWVKYAIIRISGPSDNAIYSCTRAIETFYPNFVCRKPYNNKAVVTFSIVPGVPDNMNYSESIQRSAQTDLYYHSMRLNSSYALKYRTHNPSTKPWKVSQSEKLGQLSPHLSHIYNSQFYLLPEIIQFRQPVLKAISGKMENSHLKDDPYSSNSYVRYMTNLSKMSEFQQSQYDNGTTNEIYTDENKHVENNFKSENPKSANSSISPKSVMLKSVDSNMYKGLKASTSNHLFDNKNFVTTKRSSSR